MNELDISQVIGEVAFPIIITFYLLNRFEKRLKALEKAITTLKDNLNK